jgi:hypothetical protein
MGDFCEEDKEVGFWQLCDRRKKFVVVLYSHLLLNGICFPANAISPSLPNDVKGLESPETKSI